MWSLSGPFGNSNRITSWLGILLVVGLAVYWQFRSSQRSVGPIDLCEEKISILSLVQDLLPSSFVVNDEDFHKHLVQQNPNISMCDVFSDHYEMARERFRQLVQQIDNAQLTTIPVVPNKNEKDYEYTMDVAWIPGKNDNNRQGLVVHVAGTHGVEGYAGSAIQLAFLKIWKTFLTSKKSTTTASWPTIVLVHAFNPYGMAHDRRTNENNVDLNRNGVVPPTFSTKYRFDKDDPYFQKPDNPWWNEEYYELLRSLFHPNDNDSLCSMSLAKYSGLWNEFLFWNRAFLVVWRKGLIALKRALVAGQYHDPQGLFYGGSSLQPSIVLLEQYFNQRNIAKTIVAPKNALPVITWIDIHTGLGKMGQDTLLHRHGQFSTEPSEEFWLRELERWFPQTDPEDALSVTSGYEKSLGFVIDYFYNYFAKQYQSSMTMTMDKTTNDMEQNEPTEQTEHPPWLFFAQEFGTFPAMVVGRALITENAIRHNCPNLSKAQQLQWAQGTTRKVFYPDSADWRAQVIQRGIRVLFQAIQRSSSDNHNHTSVPPVVDKI
jgi:hypothetical protein